MYSFLFFSDISTVSKKSHLKEPEYTKDHHMRNIIYSTSWADFIITFFVIQLGEREKESHSIILLVNSCLTNH